MTCIPQYRLSSPLGDCFPVCQYMGKLIIVEIGLVSVVGKKLGFDFSPISEASVCVAWSSLPRITFIVTFHIREVCGNISTIAHRFCLQSQ